MRFIVELTPAAEGRVAGSLGVEGVEGVVRFSGWLELLRLLEQHVVPTPLPAAGLLSRGAEVATSGVGARAPTPGAVGEKPNAEK